MRCCNEVLVVSMPNDWKKLEIDCELDLEAVGVEVLGQRWFSWHYSRLSHGAAAPLRPWVVEIWLRDVDVVAVAAALVPVERLAHS